MDKAYILLNFDDCLKDNDNRFELVWGEYGFKATAYTMPSPELIKKLNEAGWDISTYNNRPGFLPPDDTINNMSEENLEKWLKYVSVNKAEQEKLGVANPILWACRQNRWGKALEYAVRRCGYKIARGGGQDEPEYPYITKFEKGDLRTSPFEIFKDNIEEVKKRIDYAIEKKYALNIFTHLISPLGEDCGKWDCTEETYRKMLDYLKEKTQAGLLECVTYKEFYEICSKNWK